MSERNHAYEKRIGDLERDNIRLEEERHRLNDDPAYFEKVAREKMGIIKDGEVVYKIIGSRQKKNGIVSEESSFIVKAPDNIEAGVKAVHLTSKADAKKVVKIAVKKRAASAKVSAKKEGKPAAHKSSPTTVKKKVKVSFVKETIDSTNE